MSVLANLVVQLSANTAALEKGLSRAQAKTGGFGNAMKKVGTIAAGFLSAQVISGGFQKFTGFLSDCTAKAKEQAIVEAQLGAVLKSTGGAAGITADEVKNLASELQKTTNYGDEATIAAQNMLLTFTNIGKDIFPDATRAVQDMATAMGTDLTQQAIQVGKALQDPVLGVAALQRVGVRLTESQKEMVKSMVEVGDVAGAQKLILAELNKEFGGSAEAAVAADGGMTQMSNRMGDMQEKIGAALLPAMVKWKEIQLAVLEGIMKLGPVLQSFAGEWLPRLQAGLDVLKEALGKVKDALGPLFEKLRPLIGELQESGAVSAAAAAIIGTALVAAFVALTIAAGSAAVAVIAATWPLLAIGAAVGAVGAAIALTIKHWDDITAAVARARDWFLNLPVPIKLLAVALAWPLVPLIALGVGINELATKWGAIWSSLVGAVRDFYNAIRGPINAAINLIEKLSFGLVDLPELGEWTESVESAAAAIHRLDSAWAHRGEAAALNNDIMRLKNVAESAAKAVGGPGGLGPELDEFAGAAGGAGSAIEELAQAVDIVTPGMAALNREVEREEVFLVNVAKALTTATTQHDMITEAIATTEKALDDATQAMSDWENATLKGTRAFSDMAFGINQDIDRMQLAINEIDLGVLEEGMDEGGYASDALERKVRKLADTLGVELFGGKLDWGDIQKVLDAAGDAMAILGLESRNVNLRENLSLGPQQRALDQFFEDQKGYAEYTLPEIKKGWLKAKIEAKFAQAALDDWNNALIVNEIHMTFLQGLLDNHRAYLTDIRDLYIQIEQAAQDAWAAAAQMPTGTAVTPALPAAVPLYHQGGYVPRTGLAMLRAGETVIAPGGGSAGPTIINNFNGPLLGDRRQLEAMARALKPYLQRDHR